MDPTTKKSREVTLLFYDISRMLYHLAQYHSPKDTLTLEQLQALMYISENQKIKMNDLAKFLGISAATATSLTNRLINHDWLQREEDPKDRRVVNITLKPNGKEKLRRILEYKTKELHNALATLNQNEKDQFISTLQKLETYLTESAYGHSESHNQLNNK